ncbi:MULTISPECIES: MaoC family dehydratase [Paraglaciecola]|jgi:acyl dehydratase|uniref:Nodulation protein N n=3 Tax=Paraglaciecola TaxID=1621534 RepID=A0ABQ0I5I5_9ALTE|nr:MULTISPECIES: MaoC family dehydratase [Paraglaciecola]AEE23581.1 MaoC domain protein dehydratase [Glaciecola sp. 4H-3-7+YE-5]MBN26468.1 dehydratase [Alteromonadaceae bacterium]MBU3016474.1 MaoC family dehydratase [Paraglaciecola agarilytica]MDO6559794.1 MaoC family dehydratase [Paraglaciecola chathamensis]MDO6838331.1 MaoC family dehydratase [Paraglaciecola chathamensis]|tara:strand:- start:139033 stop:139479 length:447 start_codon:yes stop_codon:yes gene_type:complete
MAKGLLEIELGEELAPSTWLKIDQERINLFADATGDHQWIHVDPKRCARESPFKTTIAHGYLSVTLMPESFYHMVQLDSASQTVLNYGIDKIRFLEPVRVDDEIRFVSSLASKEKKPLGTLFSFDTQIEIKGRDKPAAVGKFLMMLLG